MLTDLEVRRKRFTLQEYDRLLQLGFLRSGDRIELIRGDLIEMSPKGAAHILCSQRLNRHLVRVLDDEVVQCQASVLLENSEPEPDFAVLVAGVEGKQTADKVLWVIEIADSSLNYDRAVKGPLYAEALIPHYWIFNVLDRQVECLSQPQQNAQGPNAGKWAYGVQQIIWPNQMLALPPPLSGSIDLTAIFA